MADENVTTKFKVDLSDFKKNIAEANRQIKLAQAEFKNAAAGMKDWEKNADALSDAIEAQEKIVKAEAQKLDALKSSLDAVKRSNEENKKAVSELSAKYDEAVEKFGATSDEAKAYAKQLAEAQKAQEKSEKAAGDLELQLVKVDTALKEAQGKASEYSQKLADLESDEEDASKGADGLGEAVEQSSKDAGDASEGFTVFKGVLADLISSAIEVGIQKIKELGGAIADTISDTAEYGDEVDKMSQKLGLSSEAYQEWDYILDKAGVDIQNVSTGMKTLTNKIDDAKNGSESATKLFKDLGISMEDLKTMSREDIFSKVVASMQNMEDSTERAALANDLFGKSGQDLTPLFNQTAESTEELRQAAHDLGLVMSDDAVDASADYADS